MKRILATLTVLIALSIPCMLSAQTFDDYINLKAGWFWPNQSSNGLKDFKQTLAYEFNYGRMFGRNFAAELGGIYYNTKYDGTISPESITGNSSTDITTSFYGPMATIKGIIHPIKKMDIYAGAGAGYYFSETVMKLTGESDYKAKGKGVGWHVMAGTSYDVIDKLAIGIDGKYFQAKLNSDDFSEKTDFGGITASIYLKYMF